MKTKIIYISGNEIFDMNDIRAAFEEVRIALNLDKSTVLFGVPVDEDDAGLASASKPEITKNIEPVIEEETIPTTTDEEVIEEIPEITEEHNEEVIEEEPIVVEQPKKRGRPRKEIIAEKEIENTDDTDEKVVPILSILSTNDDNEEPEQETQELGIISEISDEKTEEKEIIDEPIEDDIEEESEDEEADLEKLLSAMTPLDISEDKENAQNTEEPIEEPEDLSVDATLEQLATEFAETQDKIATENKSSSRSKIGKLRNILPFKQSKHKDQGLGDLFGWAGIAANDEDFSVPGFFTNASSKK